MDTGIGPTLREARSRRKVELSEVEEATKIRARYLRAIENEEWDALPGGAYSRGFIRTYASYLGLDGERMADEYRRVTAPPGGERAPRRVEPVVTGRRERRMRSIPARAVAVIVVTGLVAALIAIGITGRGGSGPSPSAPTGKRANREGEPGSRASRTTVSRPGVAVRLTAVAEVWVCLLDAAGEPLVDGQILEAGAEAGPYRSKRFTVSFGNGEVELLVDGKRAELPATSSPIGYEIGSSGALQPLAEGERPTCS